MDPTSRVGRPTAEPTSRAAGTTKVRDRSPSIPPVPLRSILFTLSGFLAATSLPAPIDAQAQLPPPDASAWTIASQPLMVIGGLEADANGEFAAIVDVVRGPDGTFAIVDAMLSSISFHSPDGALIAVTGRRGEGPGEFRRITGALADPQGRLFVFDQGHQRITEFTFDGTRVGDTRLTRGAADRRIGGVGRFPHGSWYAWEADQMLASGFDELARDTVGYYRFADGEVGELLGRVPGRVSTEFKVFLGGPAIRHALYSPRPLGVGWGECLLVGTSDVPELRILDGTGADVGTLSLETTAEPTTREHRDQWASSTVADAGDEAGFLQRMLVRSTGRRVRMAERVPFAHTVIVDDLGYIWAQRFRPPEGEGGAEWQVFTETGAMAGTVTLHDRFRVMEISSDEIVGVQTGGLGEEEVRVYALDRGADVDRRPLPLACE